VTGGTEQPEGAASGRGCRQLPRRRTRFAAGPSLDLEALLEKFQMLVELAKELARKPVVLERQNEVIGVGRSCADIARG